MTQQYSLRWNNHQPNFISMFTSLLNSQSLVDVTLAAEGRHLLAHKVVLSACSTYFQSLFIDNPSRHPIVILKDVTYAHLRIMVDFMYSGEVNVAADQLEKVLHTAKTLKIKGLTEMPDTTSVMRSQSAEYLQPQEPESRPPISPATSPASKRRRRRKSSTGSGNLNVGHHEERLDGGQSMEQIRESITLSSLPQLRRSGTLEDPLQQSHSSNMHMETVSLDTGASTSLQGGQWLEHSYQRYPNSCVGSGLQEPMYMNNMLSPGPHHLDQSLEYAQGMPVGGPSPGPSCAPDPPAQIPAQVQKRRRNTNPQAEENFQRALEAVRVGGIGFCKAARMFGVNNRTLWLEYKKKGYPNTRPSIRSRIKREQPTPPPKPEHAQHDQQMALMCPTHPMPVGFIDSRQLDFPIQGMPQNSPLNILGVNFNSMQ